MYLCGFTVSYIDLSEPCEEYCVSSLDQFPVMQSDAHEGEP